MVDNFREITTAPVTSSSPPATSSVPSSGANPVVESADESVLTPSDPTMAALFDLVWALPSSSVDASPVPVATPSGYVSFTGVVRRGSNVATNDPADVVGAAASSLDHLMKSVLPREGWAEFA